MPNPFYPGSPKKHPGPLARYLPDLNKGIAPRWLQENIAIGSWILDPFGTSPALTIEMARAGYRVIVASNNPINRFLLETLSTPPSPDELQAVLASLAAARIGENRVEPHILQIYETTCATCKRLISADAFLWKRDAEVPYARIYHCPHCGDEGERPATEEDAARAKRFQNTDGLHRARALGRVAPPKDPDRQNAEEALRTYLPRAVYALFTLLNKLDSLPISPHQRRILEAIFLLALDRTNTLWDHSTSRPRPKQLTHSPDYREHNVWRALEWAVEIWAFASQSATHLSLWPSQPPEGGGITLFEGRLRDLVQTMGETKISAVVTAFPRQNQAFWTLSALWAGWLWGREAMGPFKSVLRRRRYDWGWQTTALTAALKNLPEHLPEGTPFFGLIGEAEPPFVTAALVSAAIAGLEATDVAVRGRERVAQIQWRAGKSVRSKSDLSEVDYIQKAGQTFLLNRGEPASYLALHTAVVAALARQGKIIADEETLPHHIYTQVNTWVEIALNFRGGFLRFGGSDKSLETGSWWVRDDTEATPPLADRVELAVPEYLFEHPACSFAELDAAICAAFPGAATPSSALVRACLESYGVEDLEGKWRLRPEDDFENRESDVRDTRAALKEIGTRLGFSVREGAQITFLEENGSPQYAFHVIPAALLGEMAFETAGASRAYLVLPGGRAGLVVFRLKQDPRLARVLEGQWKFLKFRLIRHLENTPLLTLETLDEQLNLDPFEDTASQLPLL